MPSLELLPAAAAALLASSLCPLALAQGELGGSVSGGGSVSTGGASASATATSTASASDANGSDAGGSDADGSDVSDDTVTYAEEGHAGRFEGGFRTGFGMGLGKAGSGREVKDLAQWRVPLWVDVGYRVTEPLWLGVYGQLGLGPRGDACSGPCNWNDLRLGAQALFHLAPSAGSEAWLGIGLGYEWLSVYTVQAVEVADPDFSGNIGVRSGETIGGPELLLQAGWDFELEPSLKVGPYASVTLAQYLSDSYDCGAAGIACPSGTGIDGSSFHSWVGAGLRGSYSP